MAGSGMKSLAKDTAIYGLSSILGRVLNWLLVILYTYVFTDVAEYGKVSQIYGQMALFLVLLTYGMETGFFRFMNKKEEDPQRVYSTSLISLAVSSFLFILFCFCFIISISEWMKYTEHHEHILIMAIVIGIEAFMTIPFAYLRYQKRPIRFVTLKMTFVISNIFFNLFFLLIYPWLYNTFPDFVLNKFYNSDIGIGYIFLANLISTLIVLLLLIPSAMKGLKIYFDWNLLKRMLKYSFPLLLLAIAGVVSQTVAPLVYPYVIDDSDSQLGIYSACIKITVVITMFTQAFRYAYEPFFFGKNKEDGNTKTYADAMKYFIIFALLVFLGVMFYLDILKHIISENYTVGIAVVPIAMLGEILFGIYFNLSVWYKLTDKTKYGAYFSILGCIIQVVMNILLVPIYGYIVSAWATLIANFIIVGVSYFIGQKYFPIKYDLKKIFFYFVIAIAFYFAAMLPQIDNEVLRLAYRTIFLILFTLIIIKKDLPLSEIPIINKYIKK